MEFVLQCAPAAKAAVDVDAGRAYDAAELPPVWAEYVEARWRARIAGNPRIYNGTKFRFHSGNVGTDGRVKLRIGLTDYKHHLGTNMALDDDGAPACVRADTAAPFMANALGCSAVLITSDGFLAVQQRSGEVAEFPNAYAFPGGHSEPCEVAVTPEHPDYAAAVRDELFNGVVREVVEELGIVPDELIGEPLLLGIVRRTWASGTYRRNLRLVSVFYVRTTLSRAEVTDRFAAHTGAERFETTQLAFVRADATDASADLAAILPDLAGCSLGALALYRASPLHPTRVDVDGGR